jgi:hypothetical protein
MTPPKIYVKQKPTFHVEQPAAGWKPRRNGLAPQGPGAEPKRKKKAKKKENETRTGGVSTDARADPPGTEACAPRTQMQRAKIR